MIIHYFLLIFCKTAVDIYDTRGNNDERTLNILKLLNYCQKQEVTVSPNHEGR